MNKNILTFMALVLSAVMFMAFASCKENNKTHKNNEYTDIISSENNETNSIGTDTSEPETASQETPKKQLDISPSMDTALFIGDSRTTGLAEYSGLKSDFYANVGMSVYNIHKNSVSVPGVGKITLKELLKNKKYDKIYIMLGINEVGYKLENTVAKYRELVELVKSSQPDAVIFIQGNLHVTAAKSQNDRIINNPAINRLNAEIAKIADGEKIFYMDANKLFDDETGNLSADKTSDKVHIYARYYAEWGKWIEARTAEITGAKIEQ